MFCFKRWLDLLIDYGQEIVKVVANGLQGAL